MYYNIPKWPRWTYQDPEYVHIEGRKRMFYYITNGITNPIYPPSFFEDGYNKVSLKKSLYINDLFVAIVFKLDELS